MTEQTFFERTKAELKKFIATNEQTVTNNGMVVSKSTINEANVFQEDFAFMFNEEPKILANAKIK